MYLEFQANKQKFLLSYFGKMLGKTAGSCNFVFIYSEIDSSVYFI